MKNTVNKILFALCVLVLSLIIGAFPGYVALMFIVIIYEIVTGSGFSEIGAIFLGILLSSLFGLGTIFGFFDDEPSSSTSSSGDSGNSSNSSENHSDSYIDGSGKWRDPGEPFVDGSGKWRDPGEPFVDGSGKWRNSDEPFVDGSGKWRNPGEQYVDGGGNWRNSK
ncbi:MAG: hypothetical protein ACI4UX_03080 [Clostridia bacterium]